MRAPSGLSHLHAYASLSLALLTGACGGGDVSLPPDGQPASIAVMEGNDQSGRVGEPLADPLVVQVTDSRGRPVAGATVVFEFGSAGPGASVVPEEKTTNGDGLADTRLVLGTTVGRQTGQARVVTGEGSTPLLTSFAAVALSENANSMAAAAGQDQTGHVGLPLDDRLVVEVTDGFGNPVAGVPITWEAAGGGSVSETVVETDEDGRSRVERTLGPIVGQQTTLASSEGLAGSPVIFVHTALAGDASRLTVEAGNDQTGEVGTLLPADLVVRLVDSEGNGVPNTAVTWVAATGGGSVDPQNTTTDGEGRTSSRWTLGGTLGEQRADAVVSGVGVASFRATATSAAPPALFIITQPSAGSRSGVPLERQPVIQLRDGQGNPVATAGVQVTATLGGGGELEGTVRRNTDGSGRASFDDLSISGAPGTRTLVFSAPGYAQVTSNEIQLQATSTSTAITSDLPDPSSVGASFTVNFRVSSPGSIPTGTVDVSDGVQSCTGSLTNGAGSCQLALTTPGARTLTADYAGQSGLTGSSDTEPHTVTAAPPPPPPPPTNQAPNAGFSPPACTAGQSCQFTDGSGDTDGTVVAWNWNFGVAGTSPAQNPTATFPTSGTFEVTLTVTDDDGASASVTHSVSVAAPIPGNEAPNADYNWDCTGQTCQFTDASEDEDGSVVSWSWNFGDGGTSAERNPSHRFPAAGTYTVTLTATDDDGASNASRADVRVSADNQAPSAAFTFECDELECDFEDQSNDPDGRIEDHSWTFGDGGSSDDDDPEHEYETGGTYQVTLSVTDNDGATTSSTQSVTVAEAPPPNQSPNAAFTESCAGLTCSFSSAGSGDPDGTITYSWTFGDGGTSNDPNPSHTYAAGGTYNVRLEVRDDDNATDDMTREVTVTAPPPPNQSPTAAFSEACTDLACSFSSAGSGDPDGTITYSWSFGDPDNGTSNQENPDHTYAAAGTYTVTLTVTDDDGATSQASRSVTVTDPAPANQETAAAVVLPRTRTAPTAG